MSIETLSTRVFDLARALDVLRHALTSDDRALALLASARVRTAIVAVDHAYERSPPDALAEADLLLVYVRGRANEVLALAPAHLDGVGAIEAFLDRFAPGR
jgi:hypothetical protein